MTFDANFSPRSSCFRRGCNLHLDQNIWKILLTLSLYLCQVTYSQPVFTMPLKNLTVQVGRNATFTCHVRNIQGYRVGWVKADTKAIQAIGDQLITTNPRVSVNHERLTRHNLHIAEISLEDAGPYMCQLNTDPMKFQTGTLNVFVPADIVKVSGVGHIVEGESARLKCQATGYPPPNVYWTREKKERITLWDRKENRRFDVRRIDGNILELHKITRSQMGSYLCIATNGHPPAVSRKVQVNVSFRPVISVTRPKIYAVEGQNVVMECKIEAFPKGLHFWELETGGVIQDSNSPKYLKHDFTLDEYTIRSRLTVLNFDPEQDAGVYKCVCKNAMNRNGDRVEGEVYLQEERDEDEVEEDIYPDYDQHDFVTNEGVFDGDLESTTYYNENGNKMRHHNSKHSSLHFVGRQTTVLTDYTANTVRPYPYNHEANNGGDGDRSDLGGGLGSLGGGSGRNQKRRRKKAGRGRSSAPTRADRAILIACQSLTLALAVAWRRRAH